MKEITIINAPKKNTLITSLNLYNYGIKSLILTIVFGIAKIVLKQFEFYNESFDVFTSILGTLIISATILLFFLSSTNLLLDIIDKKDINKCKKH